ncbi:lipopolysaccharide heptosyltransferase II [Candidatus Omnitrophus magneticus]|uniref:Lipopolysaccharide heptosyltransferase II n=1 Tax=Candidatus Omnitrophus magneticus TaxID=1609969 RepID=A0A0F0CMP7_9BACT|nr:lipopolysaccharide heptosyltransferase II [Candidatus Omnitrophus magneticus]
MAELLRRSILFITNDSGPSHVASAVGTNCVVIFGRNDAGLSPVRWRPLGANNIVLHKNIDCLKCLAHNCDKNFACLKAITVEDVMKAVTVIEHSGTAKNKSIFQGKDGARGK